MRRFLIYAIPAAVAAAAALFVFTGDSTGLPLPAESVLDDPVLQAIDEALFTKAPLLDREVDFPRPAAEAERRLSQLAAGEAPDPRFLARLAEVQLSLSKFEDSERTMQRLAVVHSDKQEGLRTLAKFYHERLKISEEVETLRRLAALQEPKEKVAKLRSIISLLDQYLLEAVDREAIYRSMIATQPDEPGHVESLIEYLLERGRSREALAEAEAGLSRFPDRRRAFLALKARILRQDGKGNEAIAVYNFAFDPVDGLDVHTDYLGLLRELNRYTEYERSLRKRARLGQLDERGRAEHFLLLRSQRRFGDAAKALDEWAKSLGKLSAGRMETFARSYAAVGANLPAWRMRYTQYLTASSPEQKGGALRALFDLTWELAGSEINLGGRGPAGYLGGGTFDTSPGIAGGILSLLYNTQDVGEKLDDLERASRDYENRKLLVRLFEQFKAAYPRSEALAGMYAKIVLLFDEYNWPRTALRYAEEFMQAFPDDANYYEVAEAAVAAQRRIGPESSVREIYRKLLRRADSRGERDDYYKYLSSIVASFASKRDYAGAITQFWNEINAKPREEQLYQRLLEFLGQYQIYNEELKVYQKAIEEFGQKDYYDKLARWYIRQRRDTDFQDLTRKISDIFKESELSGFFDSFLKSGRNTGDPDSIFYRTMFEYANRRFPRNMAFVKGLLGFYSRFQLWDEFDEFSKRYFYASESIRKDWLRSLSKRKLLRGMLERFTEGAPLEAVETLPESPAEKLLLAELARWNSLYEPAEPLYDALVADHPGDEELLSTLASLKRSFGRDEEAVKYYSRLSGIYPAEKKYPTAAGEVLVEKGKLDEAARFWRGIVAIRPSDSDLYLEVASIFWDYYQFDRAAEVLLQARERLGDPQLFGGKLAAVYESAKDYDRAVAEYVRTASAAIGEGYGFEEPLQRLVYLAERKGMAAQVDSAFKAAMTASPGKPVFLECYADYLVRVKRYGERLDLLRGAIDRYDDSGFIGRLVNTFRAAGDTATEERALQRMIALEGESPETLLSLAGFYERQKRLNDAEAVLVRRIEAARTDEPEALPDYLAALDDAATFAWRHDRFDKAFGWWNTAAEAATVTWKYARLHALAQRYIQRERYEEAAAILEDLLQRAPSFTEYYSTLAQIYTKREDYSGLAALNRRAIEAVRADTQLSGDAKTARIAELRLDLIGNLVKLGDITAAVDQYIEIINREYDARNYIADAFRFAEGHGLLDRLFGYYGDLSGKSFKDFRWNVVLARLHEQRNELEAAAQQWDKAVRNEPQRIELRQAQADVLLKLQRYADAVEVYRQIYRLDRRNTHWLYTIAQTQAVAGDMAAARETLKGTLEGGPEGFSKYFRVAEILEGWGELEEAASRIDQGLAELRKDIYKQEVSSADLELLVGVGIKRGKVVETFDALLDLNNIYNRESTREGNAQAWLARRGLDLTYKAFSGAFARALESFGTDAHRRLIAERLSGYLTNFPDNSGTVNFVRETAEQMGFADITERAIGMQLGMLNTHDSRYDYRNKILVALEYFSARGQWKAAAEMLERERSRSNLFHFRDEMLGLLAELYRYAGERDSEAGILRSYIADTGGKEPRFDRSHPFVERYLNLLLERGSESELREAATTLTAYTGQVINHFLAKGRPDLAVAAIDSAALSRDPKWRDTKKLLVETYFKTGGIDLGVRAKADELMGVRPIGELVGSSPDRQRVLAGSEWYGFAGHYSEYLSSRGDSRYGAFAVAPAEDSPRSSTAQSAIASFYAKHEMYDEALRHFNLALQIAPSDPVTLSELGAMHLKRGNRDEALRTWEKIIAAGADVYAYTRYFGVLADNGLLDVGTEKTLAYLKGEMSKSFSWPLRELFGVVAYRLEQEKADTGVVVDAALAIAGSMPEPLDFLRFVIDDLSLPPAKLQPIYDQAIEAAAVVKANAPVGEGENYEYGYGSATEVHRYWLEKAFRDAVDNKLYQAAVKWIESYESYGYADNIYGYLGGDGRYWQYKARALYGVGRKAEAREALRGVWDTKPPRLSRYEIAHRILLEFGERDETENLMIGYYRDALARGREGGGVYTGLAAILLDRAGRASNPADKERLTAEAVSLLDSMVNREANNSEGMREAASLLERREMFAGAVRYRRMQHRLDRWDHGNTLALAGDESRVGNGAAAVTLFRGLMLGGQVPRAVKLEALQPYVEAFKGKATEAAAEMQQLEKVKDRSQPERLAYAELARLAGREQVFREGIDTGLTAFLEPALLEKRKAEIEQQSGAAASAIEFLRRSLAHEPSPSTRMALLKVLLDAGRNLTALQLLDEFNNSELYARDTESLKILLGLEGEPLLALLGRLVDAALSEKLFDAADSYEYRRIELAGQLKVEITERLEAIDAQRRKEQPAEPPIRIIDSIAN